MPFGLMNAPGTFQRLMSKLFCGSKWNFLFVYLDNLLIISQSFEEHLVTCTVEQVLKQLEDAGLRLRPEKCSFAHTLSPDGVSPNDNKIKAVKEFPCPTSCKEVKSFLGLEETPTKSCCKNKTADCINQKGQRYWDYRNCGNRAR